MSPRFVLERENVPCVVAEVVNRSLKADCIDFTCHKSDATQLRIPIEPHNGAYLSSFTLLRNICIVITNNRLVLLLPIESNYV